MILTQAFNLDIVKQPLQRLKVVNGDTANRFVITITNGGEAVTLDTTLHKIIAVFKRADGHVYTQDASTGLSFTSAGVVTIDVYSSSFRTGTNKITLQIYKRENSSATVYPLLCTTVEQTFTARAAAIPDSGAPNAPSQLPMLEGLIDDARDAISDCETATQNANDAADAANDAADAANTAAETLNGMLANIDDEPTQSSNNLVKSGGVYSFVSDKVQEAADDVRAQIPEGASSATAEKPKMDGTASSGVSVKWARADHVHPHDTSKQDVLTFDNAPTANSNNPVKSGGIKTAIDNAVTTATKKNLYLVKYTATSWRGEDYIATTTDSAATLDEISADALFASYVTLPSGERVAAYEYNRDGGGIYLRSEIVGEQYVTAYILDGEIGFKLRAADTPIELHVTGTQEVQGTGGQTYRTVTFASGELDKIQTFAKTRDMSFLLQDWRTGMSDMWHVLNKAYVRDDGTNLSVTFTAISPTGIGNEAAGTATGISGMSVIVYFASGVYHSAVATAFSKTF